MLKSNKVNHPYLAVQGTNSNQTKFFNSDIWTAEELGLKVRPGNSESKLYFHRIEQIWLKELTKKYIFYRSANLEFSSICGNLKAIKSFGLFLSIFFPELININQINEKILTDYYIYLKQEKYKASHRRRHLIQLKVFLDVGNSQGWFDISHEFLRDWIGVTHKDIKVIPRFIPDDVLSQLNQHLVTLPEPVQRMVLVIQECGLRVSELIGLNFDCLQQDSKGGWFLKFIRWKMKKEDIIPISHELAGVIKAQQDFIRNSLEEEYIYLFCASSRYFQNQDLVEFCPIPKLILALHHLKSFNYLPQECEQMQQISDRINQVYSDSLEETVKSLLQSLGKLNRPYLTAVEEKLLSVLESEYGREITP